jgi:hypothetical protein
MFFPLQRGLKVLFVGLYFGHKLDLAHVVKEFVDGFDSFI